MSKIKTGGGAFPAVGAQYSCEEGMSLRDFFAAKAMQAQITNNLNLRPEDIAKWSYKYADLMLAERERGE